jgi:hypothetical protein
MHVKYYFNKDSTVYINGRCDADTVIKMYPQYISTIVTKPIGWVARFKLWIVNNILWILLIGYVIYRVFGKAIKTALSIYLPNYNIMGLFSFKSSFYKAPTPVFWRKIGDSLLAAATVVAVGGIWQFDTLKEIFTVPQIRLMVGGSIIIGVVGKILTSFFKKDSTLPAP